MKKKLVKAELDAKSLAALKRIKAKMAASTQEVSDAAAIRYAIRVAAEGGK